MSELRSKRVEYLWSERSGRILDNFLRCLEARGIKYFILRNYHGLPWRNLSKDVDIVVDPRKYDEAKDVLKEAFVVGGLTSSWATVFERAHCWYGFDMKARFSIHIDLITGYASKGFEYFSFLELYERAERCNEYWVLSGPYAAVMLILYKAIGVRELNDRYRCELAGQYPLYKEATNDLLIQVFGKRIGMLVADALCRTDFDWIIENAVLLSFASKVRVFLRSPLATVSNIAAFLAEKLDRMVFRPKRYSRMIVVEGPDGAGKTTFINLLEARLASTFLIDPSGISVRHFRPGMLPNLGRVGESLGAMTQDTNFENPHRNTPAGPLSSLARLTYYWLDYCLGGFILSRRDAQFGRFSVYDRYVYDLLVDPRRSRIALPYSVRRIFARATYRPDLMFILRASPEVIYARKQELTPDEIRRQNAEFYRLRAIVSPCVQIDAEESADVMVDSAISAIISTFTTRLDIPDD